jgi:hypothetical protein
MMNEVVVDVTKRKFDCQNSNYEITLAMEESEVVDWIQNR